MARGKAVTPKQIAKAEELASKGMLIKDIAYTLGLSTTYCSMKTEIVESIHRGQAQLRQRICDEMLDNLDKTSLDLIAKQQGLFRRHFTIPKIKDIKTAKEAVVSTMDLYAEGSVTEYQMKTVQSACDSYVKMHEIGEIEERLTILEDNHNVK